MKIIFLDFDGVLNSEKYVLRHQNCGPSIDPKRMELLKEIIDETKAAIVLTTSWREHWDTVADKRDEIGAYIDGIFAEYGLRIYGKTERIFSRREEEIEAWLRSHPDVGRFAVVDDRFLNSSVINGHFVKTYNYKDGLDRQNVAEIVKILNG